MHSAHAMHPGPASNVTCACTASCGRVPVGPFRHSPALPYPGGTPSHLHKGRVQRQPVRLQQAGRRQRAQQHAQRDQDARNGGAVGGRALVAVLKRIRQVLRCLALQQPRGTQALRRVGDCMCALRASVCGLSLPGATVWRCRGPLLQSHAPGSAADWSRLSTVRPEQ